MRKSLLILSALAALLGFGAARADDVCSTGERQADNAKLASARSAEAAGNLAEALRLAKSADFCLDDVEGLRDLVLRASHRLGQAAEEAGNLKVAFEYYEDAIVAEQYKDPKPFDMLAQAKRAGLAWLASDPTNRQLAGNLLYFMNRHNQADGVAAVQDHAVAQIRRLLGEEAQRFTVNMPHDELLDEAQDWLAAGETTGAPSMPAGVRAEIDARCLARGDQMAELDYHRGLVQAISYYEEVSRTDKQDAVRSKARQLADARAGGNDWAEAVLLYELAGDDDKAEALRAQREKSAVEQETERKERFQEEQDALEQELGF
jgi:hypothetical protein